MASRTQVEVIDDLDGSQADHHIEFGIDGKTYEIDLSDKNAQEMAKALQPWVDHARPVRLQYGRSRTSASRRRSKDIRAWAAEQGIAVQAHGRLPANVIAAWETAQ
jgi:hypothetical protein